MLAPGGLVAGKIGKAAKLGVLDKKTKQLREALEKLAKDTPDTHNNWLKERTSGGGYAGSGARNRAQHERYKQELRDQEVILEPGKQAKHTPGHNNYKSGRSVSDHENPQELLDRAVGTGKPVQGTKGEPGYKEVVDFKEDIGWYVDPKTGQAHRTTRGTIHHSKDGAHIVPAHPVGQ